MKNNLRKKALLLVGVILSGFVSTAIMVPMTYASYYSDHDSAQLLQDIEMYAEAAERCAGSSKMKSYEFNLSSRSETSNAEALSYFSLNSSKIFDSGSGSGDSNLLWSEILESKTSGGNKDGKLYCSELNIYPELLQRLGIFDDTHVSQLICNSSEPGIMKVTAGYGFGLARWTSSKYDGDKDGNLDWPVGLADPENGANCSANLNLFLDYVRNHPNETIKGSGNGNTDYPFNIKFERADNASDYFYEFIKPYLGTRSQLSTETKRAMNYWTYYKTFELGCAKISDGQTNKPAASSSNMIGIYDAVSGNVYYHSLSNIHQNDKQYYTVYNSSQMTCKELAEELGADVDGGVVNDSKIDKLVIATKQNEIKGCVDEYYATHNAYGTYKSNYTRLEVAGTNFVRLVSGALDGVENKTTLYPAGTIFLNSEPALDQFNTDLSEYLATITGGIDGSAVFANNVFTSLKTAVDDILSKTDVAFDGTISSTTATSEQIAAARTLLSQASSESDRIMAASQSLSDVLARYPANTYTEGDYDSLKGSVWDVENDMVTCPGKTNLVNAFNALNLVNPPDIDAGYNPDDYRDNSGTNGSINGDVDACYNGAGVLGWIVCPITSGLAKVGSAAYEWIEENFLQIRSSIFSNDANGVREAWGTVRNIANIGFIIMLLIVIFSQITGVGIDNYGIKRILPKLIVGAIVMNLSYIVCELAIDVSNIAGSGLKNLLSSMGPTLNAPTSSGDASLTQYLVVGGTGVLAAAGIMILSSGGLGAVLTLLIALLSVVISIIVLFVVLIVRQAGVVVCVVIAPIAILMYLLPNTEKFFKRWLDLMKGLLLVYPLCGLVIGAGDFIGKIFGNLAASADSNLQMGFALSAMVVQAVPYLFIPTLLKSSLAAMGNLGAKISGLGSRLRGGATKRIQGSNAMKDSKERASEFRTRVKAGIDRDGNERKLTGVGKALRGGKRGMARARAQYLKNQDTRRRENDLMGAGFMAASAGMRAKVDESKVAAYDSLLDLGEATYVGKDDNGNDVTYSVNPNDASSVGKYHKWAIEQYEKAGDNKEKKAEAMAQIKAAQNILSKTDKGRAAVQNNFEAAVQSGRAGAVPAAAAHIMGAYGDKYKSVNRGAHAMISDLSTGVGMATVQQKINNGTYDKAGTSKYTEESLAGADDEALDRLIKRIQSNGSDRLVDYTDADGKRHTPLSDIQHTAALALQKSQTGNLNVKPEVAEKLRIIAGAQAPASVATAEPVIADEGGTFSTREVNGSQTQPMMQQAAPVQSVEVPVRQQQTVSTTGSAMDVRALGDETLLDIATNPNASANDANRVAAEQEYLRRNPGFNSGTGSTGAGTNSPQPPQVPPQA